MVNKQYNIHNPKPTGNTTSGSNKKPQYSPPPMRNIPLISTQPNPSATPSLTLTSFIPSIMTSNSVKNENLDTITEEFNDEKQQTVFGRNIKYFNEDTIDHGGELGHSKNYMKKENSHHGDGGGMNNNSFSASRDDLTTINGIDRFQYILQMDKEMKGSHPDSLYRIPSRSHNSSTSSVPNTGPNSFSSNIHFWKTDRSSSTASSYNNLRHANISKLSRTIWRYTKWPLGLLLISGLIGLIVYILVITLQNNDSVIVDSTEFASTESNLDGVFEDLIAGEGYSVDFNNDNSISGIRSTTSPPTINGHAATYPNNLEEQEEVIELLQKTASAKILEKSNQLLAVFIKPLSGDEELPAKIITTKLTTKRIPTSTEKQSAETLAIVEQVTESTFRSSGSPPGVFTFNASDMPNTTPISTKEDDDAATVVIGVSKPPPHKLHQYGFTSGHQNNFGVPIEEDARILKMLDEQLIKIEQERLQNGLPVMTTTTDINYYRTKVSPTLPVLSKFETTTEGLKRNTTEDGVCQSTFLPLCRGVLQYDLTTISRKKLMEAEYQHFQYLIDSQCSVRVAEFVCSVLEPECRPTQMGTLKPCKRICKSVLEPCAHIIASSEILTSTFDCDSYPDSNDRNVCEDPTRRSKCLNNEFKCFDSSCIPLQWKCDNIKDCSQGEDENECKFCERDEYRCLSNDKCIPDKWRCDQYDDCPDASDELDCYDDESRGFPVSYGNGRIFPFTQEIQVPRNQDNNQNSKNNDRPYFTITNDDRLSAEDKTEPYELSQDGDKYISIAAENIASIINSTTHLDRFAKRMDEENLEIQKSEETGRAVVYAPGKNLNNFQDSKEIMMTSDSETDYKFTSTSTSPLQVTTAHVSPCPEGELRCVDGRCISLEQLCDKITDCTDGSDEAMCVYKN